MNRSLDAFNSPQGTDNTEKVGIYERKTFRKRKKETLRKKVRKQELDHAIDQGKKASFMNSLFSFINSHLSINGVSLFITYICRIVYMYIEKFRLISNNNSTKITT